MNKIDEKIKAETGLKTKAGISAYHIFCMHADLEDGVLMYGNIEHDLGWRRWIYWYKRFFFMGLVSEFKNVRQATTKYPVLLGYNFMNDRDFYIPYRLKGEKRWNGRMAVECVEKAHIKNMKKWGYVFRGTI